MVNSLASSTLSSIAAKSSCWRAPKASQSSLSVISATNDGSAKNKLIATLESEKKAD
jgi:hypothetical protein